MIVLDASAALELLLNTEGGTVVAQRIRDPDESLHAPHLLAVEVAEALRRYVAGRVVESSVARAALGDLCALGVERYEHEPFLERVWELRENLTAYDALYIALAEAIGCPLITFDARLAAAPGHRATVEVLP